MSKADRTRDRILTAAEDVVLSDGVARLTLEAAAARAGVSKGGVLYHFSSRSALVSAMVRRVAGRFDAAVGAHRDGAAPGSFTRGYVRESFDDPTCSGTGSGTASDASADASADAGADAERIERLGAAILAAMACEPELMAPLRDAFAGWQRELEQDGIDPVRATIARLASDGLWLCEVFGLAPLDPQARRRVRDELLRMTT